MAFPRACRYPCRIFIRDFSDLAAEQVSYAGIVYGDEMEGGAVLENSVVADAEEIPRPASL